MTKKPYTQKQGQYLAFIFYYTKVHRCGPAEADMQRYFHVSPPSVHQMILTLEKRGLIERTPWQARSIRLLIALKSCPNWNDRVDSKMSLGFTSDIHKWQEVCL
jgi:DNA-binding MarR family transcriptional regulator